jgi:hypothetical protein
MTGYESKRAAAQDKLAQPEQEPVAYEYFKDWMVKEMPPMTIIGNPEWWAKRIYERFIYTAPPQRTWVGLTGNEWFEWWRVSKIADETEAEIDFADFLIIALAVTDKLKEKNNE